MIRKLDYSFYPSLKVENALIRRKQFPTIERNEENEYCLFNSISILYNYLKKLETFLEHQTLKSTIIRNYYHRYIKLYNILVLNYNDKNAKLLAIKILHPILLE